MPPVSVLIRTGSSWWQLIEYERVTMDRKLAAKVIAVLLVVNLCVQFFVLFHVFNHPGKVKVALIFNLLDYSESQFLE